MSNSTHSKNKTILITGGASGIGLGIAQQLGASGHKIIVADMNMDAAEHAAAELGAQGISARALLLDVTNPQQVASLPDTLLPDTVDVLINNAGIQHVSKLEDFPADKWQQLINIMLVAPAMLTQALLPAMRVKNYGRIINIGSVHSVIASPFKSAYVAAKHGLLGFSKTIALETGDCDVTINTLCPAYVKTPLVEKQIAAQAKEHGMSEEDVINKIMLEPMPKKSFIDIDELASSAAFLMDNSARNITGQTIVIDGGWTAR
ncbi:MAG: 3-hydroxybutyrate dehydrogenase [Alteromonadaceae bacterium]|uniref:D-beta-hydroxybutyrate dehydrogenase n=1 Tax=Paraglaciecola agarilytica NO2 TaxID=1125747 RepID=A0ABQ0ID39_9ALTE|nr:3-hydroxybutyrate dehydrogenase [Paraglaciecola agarilytica]AEE23234.1 3-hydroxybutyrate dehydrogenase [Glaciecola sp. 4H-3-7+YE-5]MBN25208.1 3-hydroxybutyrate dehydrogenase [Alteromonadaceae bacterium]GAC07245.1 D-beta-hydroxybutyrate dehydrogenase [Paraglaciecola agarilytica NO2]|tara:strand:- start:29600 stop:30385 length:786 start_codon:yes stop_codon:yes gene_type:complete